MSAQTVTDYAKSINWTQKDRDTLQIFSTKGQITLVCQHPGHVDYHVGIIRLNIAHLKPKTLTTMSINVDGWHVSALDQQSLL